MKKICLTTIFIIIFSLGIYGTVKAVTNDELETRRQELEEKIEQYGIDIENIQVELTDTLEKINDLDKQIYEYEDEIKSIDTNLEDIEKEIKEKEIEIEAMQKEYDQVKKSFAERIVYLYETNDTRYLDVLLNSKSIVDFISNYYLIGEMAEYDANLIEKLEKNKDEIVDLKEDLAKIQENLETAKLAKQKVSISLENAKVVKNSYANNLTAQEKEIQAKLDLYQEQMDIIELQMLVSSLDNNDITYVGGIFLWPLPGHYTITSPFGMRIDPIIKVYRGHNGMDIAAPMGTYILAANSGVVSAAYYSNAGYGNYVIINHGNGISTGYAHGSKILVEEGQVVKRGEPIMRVGSTGWSTGPHLHLQLIVNGVMIDPYPYVTKTVNEVTDEYENIQNKQEQNNQINQNEIQNNAGGNTAQ